MISLAHMVNSSLIIIYLLIIIKIPVLSWIGKSGLFQTSYAFYTTRTV